MSVPSTAPVVPRSPGAPAVPDRARSSLVARAAAVVALVPGVAIGAGFGLVAKVRRTKPLHPIGVAGIGSLQVTAPDPSLGVPLLARTGTHSCLVRWSRSAGLPAPLPDVEGLAIRVQDSEGAEPADLLFASTGLGSVRRFVLAPRRPDAHGPASTILPVASAAGPLLFAVEPVESTDEPPDTWDLAVAVGRGAWRTVGRLTAVWGHDRPTRFDPIQHQLPGTRQYPVVQVLREPAYFFARRATAART